MIRPIVPADGPALVAITTGSGLFTADDSSTIAAMLDDYHATSRAQGHSIITYETSGTLVGLAYVAPKVFTDRVWELLMIAVDELHQRRGVGSQLLMAGEALVRTSNGRLLLIETSDKSSFERTRQFYRKHHYAEVAHIADYFADGDGKASFVKRL